MRMSLPEVKKSLAVTMRARAEAAKNIKNAAESNVTFHG